MPALLALFVWMQARLSSVARPSTRLAHPTAVRAAGFVEYAMLAAIAIAIFLVFRDGLVGAFNELLDQINRVLGSNN